MWVLCLVEWLCGVAAGGGDEIMVLQVVVCRWCDGRGRCEGFRDQEGLSGGRGGQGVGDLCNGGRLPKVCVEG